MATFVLVHGAWHGAWCWKSVTPLLERDGHVVDALDLPGHGDDRAEIQQMTLEAYARRVAQHVEAADAEKVVLVGHSMGGMSIAQAAELVPERIETLVYVTAFLPANGQSLIQLADNDPEALVLPNLVANEEEGWCVVADDAIRDVFYGECSDEDVAYARGRLVRESLGAMASPISTTDGRAGSIRRAYIHCLRDRAISIAKQREMVAARGADEVVAIDTDHSPFFSQPDELAHHLLSFA